MALVLADRIKESTTVTSTGPATLLGAATGFQAFSVLGNGSTTYYCIADQTGANWEVGLGTYSTTGPTLTRTTILSSSNAGSAVNFGAGTKDVFVTIPAGKGVWTDSSNNVTLPAALTITANATVNGLTVGKGAGTGSNNAAFGINALLSNTTGYENTASGTSALSNNTTGNNNTASGAYALMLHTTGNYNTASGAYALTNNTTGYSNTANGVNALKGNTTGYENTASGVSALSNNTTGNENTANGRSALQNNTTGNSNTANGVYALANSTTGARNTANGYGALLSNTTGNDNTASGASALYYNTTGTNNVAVGYQSLRGNTTGASNTALGQNALISNTTGSNNSYVGIAAGYENKTGSSNSCVGSGAIQNNVSGGSNVAFGASALGRLRGSSYNIAIGASAMFNSGDLVYMSGGLVVGVSYGINSLGTGSQANWNTLAGTSGITYIVGSIFTCASSAVLGDGVVYNNATKNVAIGYNSGYNISSGSNNVVIGGYTGSATPISATGSNFVVLSDGAGTVRQTHNASGSLAFDTAGTAFGTSGQVLQSNGNAAVPTWVTPAGGGSSALTVITKSAAYTVVAGDLGKVINCSGTITISLTAAATLGAGFYCTIVNVDGNNIVTIDPSDAETLNGYATWGLNGSQSVQLYCTGTAFNLISGQPTFFAERPYAGVFTRPVASSNEAIAIGDSAVASGGAAMAMGVGANAAGSYGLALGRSATVSISYGTAIGANSGGGGSVAATGAGAMALGGSYASGADSFATNISNNTNTYGAQGTNSIAMGYRGKATGNYSVAISAGSSSENAVASGQSSIMIGQGAASGQGSSCLGISVFSANYSKTALCGNTYANTAQSEGQLGMMSIIAITTDATPTQLRAANQSLTALWLPTLYNNSAVYFKGTVVARRKAAEGTASAAWTIEGLIRREGTAASTTMVTSSVTVISNVPAWAIAVSADTTNGAINVTFTGAAATNIRVLCNLQMTELNNYA